MKLGSTVTGCDPNLRLVGHIDEWHLVFAKHLFSYLFSSGVLLPKTGKGPFLTVICLHGGGWVKGSRKSNLPLMIKLAQEGYAAVSVQYRLGSRFPAAVHDVKCAVRWLRANAAVFNLDSERLAALGHSSGWTMACLLGLTTPLDGLEGKGVFNG